MEREEKFEKFRTEYMLLEVLDVAECRSDIVKYLKREAKCLSNTYTNIVNSIRYNKVRLFFASRVSGICDLLGIEEDAEEYFRQNIEALESFGESVGVYEYLYQRMLASVTDDNWSDIYRLAEFTGEYFLKTDDYYDRVFKCINVSYSGIRCTAGGGDETNVFMEFFNEELGNILTKGVEKVKKGEKNVE